jgi:hypothetical protein
VSIKPLAQISLETREKEADGGRMTADAGHVQQSAAERSLGKSGGIHNGEDLHEFAKSQFQHAAGLAEVVTVDGKGHGL